MIRAALALLLAASPVRAADRIVSLNLCTDEMLVLLAPERIAALSPLARDTSISVVAEQARMYPSARPAAEAVLARNPDLILAGPYGAQTLLPLLEARGLPVWRATLPEDFPGIRAEFLRLAEAIGEVPRAGAIISDMDARLAALPRPGHPARALIWGARGYTSGPGSLGDAVLHAAGLVDAGDGRQLGLEALLRDRPDLLVTPPESDWPSLATALLRHPAVASIPRREVPPALTLCAGPWTVRAAELLAE